MKKFILIILLTSLFSISFGQITTTVNPSIAQMQALLQGNGVTVTGLSLTCPAGAYATFGNGAAALGNASLNSGILLTTGSATNVAGPPSSFISVSSGAGGSALGNSLSNGTTFDGCYMTFQLTPTCATLSINYVFASEEYPEFATGTINDAFGFVLTGPNPSGPAYANTNIATLPVTTTTSNVVSIQNVNNGSTNTGPCVNCAYYIDSPPGLIYDGATTVLTASASVTPCQTYTMTIGVWDDTDGLYDSGVFLDVNGLSCANQPTITASVNPSSICSAQTVTLTAAGGLPIGTYTWSAPASGGLAATSGSVVTANPTAATTYTLKYSDINTCPGFPVTTTVALNYAPISTFTVTKSPTGVICSGQSATLTATGGTGSYSWNPSTGLSATTGSVVVASPPSNTTYTVIQTSGTCTNSTVVTVSVSVTPTVAVTPSLTTICVGQSVGLSASGPGPFNWVASSGVFPVAAANVTVSPAITTTYTVKSGVGSCTTSAVAIVNVSSTSPITITPSSSTICIGQSASLSSSGSGPFIWTASSGTNPPSAANVTVTPTSLTTYTVVSGIGTCTSSATATVNLSPAVQVTVTPTFSAICVGQSVALSATGAGPFGWTASSGTNPASVANVTVSPTSTTTYTVISGTGSCTTSAVSTVSINTVPSISITPSSTIICNGQSTSLTVSSGGPFIWTASSGTNPTNSGTVTVNPTTTTTYTVLSGTGTCTTTAIATVSISPTLTLSITPSNTNICIGSSTTLNANGATTYTWLPGSSSLANNTVNPITTTTYTLIGSNGVCTNSASATVSVTTVSATLTASSPSYCLGGTPVTLTGSGAATYSWSPSTGLNSTSGSVVTATVSATTIYSVTGTLNGCSSTRTISIALAPIGTITASGANTLICVGGTATLTASGANTYSWVPGSMSTPNVNVSPSTTTNYTVAGVSAQGCVLMPSVVTVSVLANVTPTLTASSPTACLGSSISISAAPSAAGLTYTWSPSSAIQGSNNTPTITALPISSAPVTYSVIISNGVCVGTKTIQIQIATPPVANFILSTNDTICAGGCVTFSSTTSGGNLNNYQWYYGSGVGTSSVGITPQACYPSAGTYSVMMIASNGCGSDTVVKTNCIKVFDLPVLVAYGDTTINIGESATIFANATGATSYNWSPNVNGSISCPTCSTTIVQPSSTTNYIVVASNTPYCRVQDTVTIIVEIVCGEFFVPNAFSPNGDGLNDMVNIHGKCISTFILQIFNRWGEKVFETTSLTDSWDGTFRGQKLDTGVFVYKAEGVSIDGKEFKTKGNITLIR